MSIAADLRDKMIDLYEDHKNCDWLPNPENYLYCSVGEDFMSYMQEWIKN